MEILNVICDKPFTSVPLAEDLLLQHTTIAGTLRKNKDPSLSALFVPTYTRTAPPVPPSNTCLAFLLYSIFCVA